MKHMFVFVLIGIRSQMNIDEIHHITSMVISCTVVSRTVVSRKVSGNDNLHTIGAVMRRTFVRQ